MADPVTASKRNVATLERLARELQEQCRHYRRNSEQGDDEVRFLIMENLVCSMLLVANYGVRRYYKRRQKRAA